MKLPEPYLYYADGETFTVEGVADLFSNDGGLEKLFTETQLKAEIERREAVLREVLDQLVNLQPILANGLLTEQQLQFIDPHIDEAMRVIQEVLG